MFTNYTGCKDPLSIRMLSGLSNQTLVCWGCLLSQAAHKSVPKSEGNLLHSPVAQSFHVLTELCSSGVLNGMKSTRGTTICYTRYLWPACNSLLKAYSSLCSWPSLPCGTSLLLSVYLHASWIFPVLKKCGWPSAKCQNITTPTWRPVPYWGIGVWRLSHSFFAWDVALF